MTRHLLAQSTPCFGSIRSYSGREARQRGFSTLVSLCLRHSEAKAEEQRRCAMAMDRERCAGRLRPCPERLLPVLDDLTNAVVAYLCAKHNDEADSRADVTEHPSYESPAKRVAIVAPSQSIPETRKTIALGAKSLRYPA